MNDATKISTSDYELLTSSNTLDRILSGTFYITFLLILIVFEIIQRLAHTLDVLHFPQIGKRSYQQWAAICLNKSLRQTIRVVGADLNTEFTSTLDPDKQYIFTANHQSFFDTFLLVTVLSKWNPKFVAKKELGKWIPSISFNLRTGGHALIDRSNPRQAIPLLESFAKNAMGHGDSIIVFPEGTRSRDGSLLQYRISGFQKIISTMSGVEVVPVAIDGSWRTSAKRNGVMPRGITIMIKIGAPIALEDDQSAKDLLEKARSFTEQCLIEERKSQTKS